MTYQEFLQSTYQYGSRYSYAGREVKVSGWADSGTVQVSYDLDTTPHYPTARFSVGVSELKLEN